MYSYSHKYYKKYNYQILYILSSLLYGSGSSGINYDHEIIKQTFLCFKYVIEFIEIAKVLNMKILVLRNSKVSVQALLFSIQGTVRKHLTGGFLCGALDLSGILCSLLIPEYSGIKRSGKPLPGLKNAYISFVRFSIQ